MGMRSSAASAAPSSPSPCPPQHRGRNHLNATTCRRERVAMREGRALTYATRLSPPALHAVRKGHSTTSPLGPPPPRLPPPRIAAGTVQAQRRLERPAHKTAYKSRRRAVLWARCWRFRCVVHSSRTSPNPPHNNMTIQVMTNEVSGVAVRHSPSFAGGVRMRSGVGASGLRPGDRLAAHHPCTFRLPREEGTSPFRLLSLEA